MFCFHSFRFKRSCQYTDFITDPKTGKQVSIHSASKEAVRATVARDRSMRLMFPFIPLQKKLSAAIYNGGVCPSSRFHSFRFKRSCQSTSSPSVTADHAIVSIHSASKEAVSVMVINTHGGLCFLVSIHSAEAVSHAI